MIAEALLAAALLQALASAPLCPDAPTQGGVGVVGVLGSEEMSTEGLLLGLQDPELEAAARAELLARGPAVLPEIVSWYRVPEIPMRHALAGLLGSYPGEELALAALVEMALGDRAPHVRARALESLGGFPEEAVAAELTEALAKASEPNIRWRAAVALAAFGRPEALPALHAGALRLDGWARWEAIQALGQVHDARTPEVLGWVLDHASPRYRGEAALALGRIGGEASVELLNRSLEDPSPEVRWRAALALGAAGDASTVAALRARHAEESNPKVRMHLERAIGRLAGLARR